MFCIANNSHEKAVSAVATPTHAFWLARPLALRWSDGMARHVQSVKVVLS